MPLRKGRRNMGRNYRELRKAGYPKRQAQAIMLSKAFGKRKRRKRR